MVVVVTPVPLMKSAKALFCTTPVLVVTNTSKSDVVVVMSLILTEPLISSFSVGLPVSIPTPPPFCKNNR